jgi:hypothetical protein
VSITTPVRGPARSTSPSPWPTSQATRNQPLGGHPVIHVNGMGARTGCTSQSPVTAAATRLARLRPSSHGAAIAAAMLATASTPIPSVDAGHEKLAPGTAAAAVAISTIHRAA